MLKKTINDCCIAFMQRSPFYCEISRSIRKVETRKVPTAGVCFNVKADEFQLLYNPDYFDSLTLKQACSLFEHEFNHIVFGHLTTRKLEPHNVANIAQDLAINSLIETNNKNEPVDEIIPEGWFLPGRAFDFSKVDPAKVDPLALKMSEFIKNLPKLKSSEFYFAELMQNEDAKDYIEKYHAMQPVGAGGDDDSDGAPGGDENCGGGDPSGMGKSDSHNWSNVPEEMREYIEERAKNIVKKGVRAADQQQNGWGNIPAEIREEIRRLVSNAVDWKSVLKQFVGNLVPYGRATSIKKISRKYPFIHPGIKRNRTAKLLIAIDQSGSVTNEWLEEFFGTLATLNKKVTIDVLPFDCEADPADIQTWAKGKQTDPKRTKCGGTDFNAPTEIFNAPENRGRWEALIICTDGQAPQPVQCRRKRAWVLAKGCELAFQTDELKIVMSNDAKRGWS